jgi:hypothetical protein
VLVFALFTASIGLVYASGFTGLNDVREFEQVNNAERAFEVLADNIEDMTHRNAPSRATEIKLAGAELRIADPIEIEVNDPDSNFSLTREIRPVIFDADTGTEIVYVQGAVIRTQDDGGVVITESSLVLGENRTLIPVIQTRLQGSRSVSGSTTVLLRADLSSSRLLYANDTASNQLWVNVTSPRAGIWRAHLTSTYDDVSCEPLSGDTVSCQVTTDRAHVTLFQIDLEIE